MSAPIDAQGAIPKGEWRYIGGDAWHTRYLPLDQITSTNFENLEIAWVWRGDNFGPTVDFVFRSTPIYVDGILYTVAGARRTVAAIDPRTGETLTQYRHRLLRRAVQLLRTGEFTAIRWSTPITVFAVCHRRSCLLNVTKLNRGG